MNIDLEYLKTQLKLMKAKPDHRKVAKLIEMIEQRMYFLQQKQIARDVLEGEGACDFASFISGLRFDKEHRRLDKWADEVVNNGKTYKAIFGFRGLGKSTWLRYFITKRIIKHPFKKRLYVCSKTSLSISMIAPIKRIFEVNDNVKTFYGNFEGEMVWSRENLLVKPAETMDNPDNANTLEAGGPDSKQASKHYDEIYVDDLIGKDNVIDSKEIESAITFYNLLSPLLNPGGFIMPAGMRWDTGDMYDTEIINNEQRKDITDVIILAPIKTDENGIVCDKNGEPTEDKIGNNDRVPTCPEMFPLSYLDQKRMEFGEFGWNSQYMQNPKHTDHKILDFKKLLPLNQNEYEDLVERIVIGTVPRGSLGLFIDTTNTVSDQSDSFGISLWHYDKKFLYIVKFWKVKYNFEDACKLIRHIVVDFNLTMVLLEKSGAYENIRFNLRKELNRYGRTNCMIEDYSHKGERKELRIASINPFIEMGSVRICPDFMHETEKGKHPVSMYRELKKEMDIFPSRGSKVPNDIIDTFGPVTEYFGLDTEFFDPSLLDKKPVSMDEIRKEEEDERRLVGFGKKPNDIDNIEFSNVVDIKYL